MASRRTCSGICLKSRYQWIPLARWSGNLAVLGRSAEAWGVFLRPGGRFGFGSLSSLAGLAFDVGGLAWVVRGPWATGLSGHAVNPSVGLGGAIHGAPRSRQAGSPRTRQMAGADGKGGSEKAEAKSRSEKRVGVEKKSGSPAARLQASRPPSQRTAHCRPKPRSRRPASHHPSTHFHSLLLLLLLLLLLSPWLSPPSSGTCRRLGDTGGSGPWGAMDGATEPPWMDSRRVPIRRYPRGACTVQASRSTSKANPATNDKEPENSGRQAATPSPLPARSR